tara:strand:- start:677 stop:1354 length:678 start_codon:yes stop_codon:yes gene_type:complete
MIAIIPARSGSKGLPNKNILELNGKPLIAYTIEAAINAKYISEVIISTDDPQIAKMAEKYGAKTYFLRPKELATDDALAVDNYIYTINKLNEEFDFNIIDFIVLQPTSPLRISQDIDDAIELFKKVNADSIISYTEENHPISWHKYITDDNLLVDVIKDDIKNRQDYKKSFYPNGAIYIFKIELINQRKYFSNNTQAFIMPKNRSIDIDYKEDFEYVEFLLNKRT